MTNFKITFERSNGTKGNDTFTENTKQEAIKAFNNCYRHDTYKILSIEKDNSDVEKTTICLHDEVYTNNQLIQELKQLANSNSTDFEAYKMIINELKYL